MGMSEFENKGFSLLSKPEILKHRNQGNIIIDPFHPENVRTVSVDVTLGENLFRPHPELIDYYNAWDEEIVRTYWGESQLAPLAEDIFVKGLPIGVRATDRVIIFSPYEMILCHTDEFIGGRNKVTTMMKARSTIGRSNFEICRCAGWGDVGYISRWTMEVQNTTSIPNFLIVGERVSQIAFFEVVAPQENYADFGKYQTSVDIEEVKRSWTPEQMLPKLWMDKR